MPSSGRDTRERTGALVTWNDAKGFGFIRPDGGGEDVFVHMAAFGRGAERPVANARIAYVPGAGRGGREMATRARLVAPGLTPGALRLGRFKLRRRETRIALAFLLALLAIWSTAIGEAPPELLGPYLGMGLVAMLFYRADKGQARSNSWRVSETTLHATDLVFGIIGGLLAQGLFGHKTAKKSFAIITGVIFAGHVALLLAAGTGIPKVEDIERLRDLAAHLFDADAPAP